MSALFPFRIDNPLHYLFLHLIKNKKFRLSQDDIILKRTTPSVTHAENHLAPSKEVYCRSAIEILDFCFVRYLFSLHILS